MSEAKKSWVNKHTGFWEYDPATIKPDVDYYVPVVMYEQYQALRDENARLKARLEKILLAKERVERELRGYPPLDSEGVPMMRESEREPWRKEVTGE